MYIFLERNSKGILRFGRCIPRLHHPLISRPVLVLIARIPTTNDPVARMHATRPIATRLEGDRNRFDFYIFPSLLSRWYYYYKARVIFERDNNIGGRRASREQRIVLPIALFQPDCVMNFINLTSSRKREKEEITSEESASIGPTRTTDTF